MSESPSQHEQETRRRGYEPDATSLRGVMIFMIALVVMLAVSHGVVLGLMGLYAAAVQRPTQEEPPREPVLRRDILHWAAPPAEYARFQQRWDQRLNDYRWVDRQQGIVAIPIDEAMRLIASDIAPPATQPTQANPNNEGASHDPPAHP
ncbi:MAG TPA: hypothetical protein VF184_07625 [Phycisphaeraceae bacterium]